MDNAFEQIELRLQMLVQMALPRRYFEDGTDAA
jgi:hypothetical protein